MEDKTNLFDNITFDTPITPPTISKWKDHPTGIYAITSKTLSQSKFGPSYILELQDKDTQMTKVYTPKYITEYLNTHNPRYIQLIKDGDTNKASFAN